MSESVQSGRHQLYAFAISHYCEKARWALDRVGIEYEIQYLAPGVHLRIAKKLGASRSSVPILKAGSTLIQGSSQVIDWAERTRPGGAPALTPSAGDQDYHEVEQRLDAVLGVHVRRYYYSEALVEYPKLVKAVFSYELPSRQRLAIELGWPLLRRLMMKRMNLGHMQGIESREILEREFDWLDFQLGRGREFLGGDRFSRLDITAASLLAPLILPPKHPTYECVQWSPNVALDCEGWSGRPCFRWARDMYHRFRS